MPNDVEKESEHARRQRVREENRRRKNEQRLEGQRREYERKSEALRKKATAVEEGDALAAHSQNESSSNGETTRVVVDQLGDKEPAAAAAAAVSRSDGQRKKRPRNPKRSGTAKAAAEPTSPAPVPAKNEHPELHVIAQLTPLAPPSPPLTPSSHSGKDETCIHDEDFRTRMEADYLFDPPLRCAPCVPPMTEAENAQTREAAADVLFFDPQLLYDVPIVKIGRPSAAFYRNGMEPGNTRQPQKFSGGRGRGRGFGWYGRGGRAPRSEPSRVNWG